MAVASAAVIAPGHYGAPFGGPVAHFGGPAYAPGHLTNSKKKIIKIFNKKILFN